MVCPPCVNLGLVVCYLHTTPAAASISLAARSPLSKHEVMVRTELSHGTPFMLGSGVYGGSYDLAGLWLSGWLAGWLAGTSLRIIIVAGFCRSRLAVPRKHTVLVYHARPDVAYFFHGWEETCSW